MEGDALINRFSVRLVGLLLTLAAFGSSTGFALPSHSKLRDVQDFALATGPGALEGDYVSRLGRFDLVIVDGEEATASQVRELQSRGVIVLGYLSVGTVEPWRWWYRFKEVRTARLEHWEYWEEWIADTSKPGFRSILVNKVAPAMLRKGFDGLYLGRFSIIDGRPKQRAGMFKLVRELSRAVHACGGIVLSENGERWLPKVIPFIDGWVHEVSDLSDEGAYRRITNEPPLPRKTLNTLSALGLFTAVVDYRFTETAEKQSKRVSSICDAGALPYFTDPEGVFFPEQPFSCRE